MIRKIKWSKMLTESMVGSVFTVIIAILVSAFLLPMITGITGSLQLAIVIECFLAGSFLAIALVVHKGVESLPQDLVSLAFILGFATLIGLFIPELALVYEVTYASGMLMTVISGIMLLAVSYLGLGIGKKTLRSFKF